MLTSLLSFIAGCTIGTPWPRMDLALAEPGEQVVVLALTHVVIDPARRPVFNDANRRVLASMRDQPGLLGYAARRQVFGNEGWTMSVWEDDQARARFLHSPVHLDAIRHSQSAVVRVTTRRFELARKDLPRNWDEALLRLAEPGMDTR
ncbi:MAG: antibiotic biosynthesis monooxygenase [Wenzhouxiangella sp.]